MRYWKCEETHSNTSHESTENAEEEVKNTLRQGVFSSKSEKQRSVTSNENNQLLRHVNIAQPKIHVEIRFNT